MTENIVTAWTNDSVTFYPNNTVDNCTVKYTEYPWWPTTWTYTYPVEDKFGKAFRIAQKLMELEMVDIGNSVKKFTKLVNEIAGIV